MKHIVLFNILLSIMMLCLASGCRSLSPPDITLKPFVLDPIRNQTPPLDLTGTNTVSIQDVIAHALRTDADINERAARCHRAAGDLAGIHPESPEIRVGYDRSRDDRRGRSSGQEWGSSTQTGVQRSTGSGTQTTERQQTAVTDYANPLDPNQTSIEDSTTQESSQSYERETFRSHSSFFKSSSAFDYQRQQEDGVSIALRIAPPNPWLLSAERQAGKAVQTIDEAELLVREQKLACDIVEASLRLHYQQSMLRLQTAYVARVSSVQENLRTAFEKGGLPADIYAEGCRLMSTALAKQHRMETSITDLERDLRLLTGVDPDRLALDALREASIVPLSVPKDQTNDVAWASLLTKSHAVVLSAQWNLHLMEAEWKKARIATIPWASRLMAGYAWWDGTRYGYGSFERSGFETQTTASQSTRDRTNMSNTHGTEVESSGDVTTRDGTAQQSSVTRTDQNETQKENSSSAGSETSDAENDGKEWWVEIGVEIPVFEWLSGESRVRKQAAKSAREACERVQQRVYSSILSALHATRQTRDTLQQSNLRFHREYSNLNQYASIARLQGLPGEVKALRANEEIIEMAILFLDCSLREALAKIELVRAAGLSPFLGMPVVSQEDSQDETNF
ncbi:MAG: hypothetical protein PHR77_13575 [Kiritimatiellae bacterium]|nr:hypothetical protein [Kiritimatiellia bacterium]MDD5522984.1 hypothetical protein [Kiritimatiellia bacterium]